jgi:hypothetical protein
MSELPFGRNADDNLLIGDRIYTWNMWKMSVRHTIRDSPTHLTVLLSRSFVRPPMNRTGEGPTHPCPRDY